MGRTMTVVSPVIAAMSVAAVFSCANIAVLLDAVLLASFFVALLALLALLVLKLRPLQSVPV